MASTLNATLAERQVRPYAVGVKMDDGSMDYSHFGFKSNAALWANYMEHDHLVTRWVALTEPEWNPRAVTPGWRQVTHFG